MKDTLESILKYVKEAKDLAVMLGVKFGNSSEERIFDYHLTKIAVVALDNIRMIQHSDIIDLTHELSHPELINKEQ